MEKEGANQINKNSFTQTNQGKKSTIIWSSLLLSASLIISSPKIANADYEAPEVCPKGSGLYLFTLQPGETCRGEKFGKNLCSECRTKDGRVLNTPIESMQKKVEAGINSSDSDEGKRYTSKEVKAIKETLRRWNKEELENLIKKLNGNLDDEERTIFRGALEHWPDIKYHAMRLSIDPRITYLVAVAESRFVQKIGKSGELSPMQIMPDTMALMFNRYGRNDEYIKGLVNKRKDWRKDTTAQIILALYYLRDGISTVAPIDAKIERLNAEDLLMIYHFYNRGHNKYIVNNWWQGDNFATCVSKYLRLYPEVEKFIDDFIRVNKESDSIISKTWNSYFHIQNKKKKDQQMKEVKKEEKVKNEAKTTNKKEIKKEENVKKETKDSAVITNSGVVTNNKPKSEDIFKSSSIAKTVPRSSTSSIKPQQKTKEENKQQQIMRHPHKKQTDSDSKKKDEMKSEIEKYNEELERIRSVLKELKERLNNDNKSN
ncbi:MAG: hypothetical protein QXE90_02605 [Candidatus Micrarchaeia archaeon]